jgi:hypothetical protein
MRPALSARVGIFRQRGSRLRCFLGRTLLLALVCAVICCVARAQQLEMDGPIRLARAEGIVTDSYGKPVANVEVALLRDDKVRMSTRTDQAGAFRFDHAEGGYLLRVARTENAPAARQIVVRAELGTLLERKKLYVVLGPGACADECSSVYTSKQEFDHAIRKMNGR